MKLPNLKNFAKNCFEKCKPQTTKAFESLSDCETFLLAENSDAILLKFLIAENDDEIKFDENDPISATIEKTIAKIREQFPKTNFAKLFSKIKKSEKEKMENREEFNFAAISQYLIQFQHQNKKFKKEETREKNLKTVQSLPEKIYACRSPKIENPKTELQKLANNIIAEITKARDANVPLKKLREKTFDRLFGNEKSETAEENSDSPVDSILKDFDTTQKTLAEVSNLFANDLAKMTKEMQTAFQKI